MVAQVLFPCIAELCPGGRGAIPVLYPCEAVRKKLTKVLTRVQSGSPNGNVCTPLNYKFLHRFSRALLSVMCAHPLIVRRKCKNELAVNKIKGT